MKGYVRARKEQARIDAPDFDLTPVSNLVFEVGVDHLLLLLSFVLLFASNLLHFRANSDRDWLMPEQK